MAPNYRAVCILYNVGKIYTTSRSYRPLCQVMPVLRKLVFVFKGSYVTGAQQFVIAQCISFIEYVYFTTVYRYLLVSGVAHTCTCHVNGHFSGKTCVSWLLL